MKFLSVAGTAAMFLVGGGILTHAIGPVHDAIQAIRPDGAAGVLVSMLADAGFGIAVGALAVAALTVFRRIRAPDRSAEAPVDAPASPAAGCAARGDPD
jgi:predicted DNA repair protein MutK